MYIYCIGRDCHRKLERGPGILTGSHNSLARLHTLNYCPTTCLCRWDWGSCTIYIYIYIFTYVYICIILLHCIYIYSPYMCIYAYGTACCWSETLRRQCCGRVWDKVRTPVAFHCKLGCWWEIWEQRWEGVSFDVTRGLLGGPNLMSVSHD